MLRLIQIKSIQEQNQEAVRAEDELLKTALIKVVNRPKIHKLPNKAQLKQAL